MAPEAGIIFVSYTAGYAEISQSSKKTHLMAVYLPVSKNVEIPTTKALSAEDLGGPC